MNLIFNDTRKSVFGHMPKQYFPWSDENIRNAVEAYAHCSIPQVYLELGRACSLKCAYCDSPDRSQSRDALTNEEIESLLDRMQKMGLQFVFICGYGEPLEDPRFMPLLRSAVGRNLCVSFFSNLQPAYRDYALCEELAALRPNILVKYDSTDTAIFDGLLGVPGSAKNIEETIQRLRKLGFIKSQNECTNLGLSIVPTSRNIDNIVDVVSFALNIGAYPCIGEMEVKGRGENNRKKLEVPTERLRRLKKDIHEKFAINYNRPLCQGVFCGLHVKENGDSVIDGNTGFSCGWFLPMTNQKLVGNVRNSDIREIWHTVVKHRLEHMEETVTTLKALPAIVGLGGGGIPSQWADIYQESTLQLARNLPSPFRMNKLRELVSRIYGIGRCIQFSQCPEGYLNDVFIVQTRRNRYILKKHVVRNTEAKLRAVISLLGYLKSRNFPCDYLIPTKSNDYFIEFRGGIYSLHNFIDGSNYSSTKELNSEQIIVATKVLAEYHRVVWEFKPEGENLEPSDLPLMFTCDASWFRLYIENHCHVFANKEQYHLTLANIEKLEKNLAHKGILPLPHVPIHGDFGAHNMMFRGNRFAGVFDWDLLQYAPRMVDVCGSLARNSVREKDGSFNFGNFKRFISTYQIEARKLRIPLSSLEIHMLPEIIRISLLLHGVNASLLLSGIPLRPIESQEQRQEVIRHRIDDTLDLMYNFDKCDWGSLFSELS